MKTDDPEKSSVHIRWKGWLSRRGKESNNVIAAERGLRSFCPRKFATVSCARLSAGGSTSAALGAAVRFHFLAIFLIPANCAFFGSAVWVSLADLPMFGDFYRVGNFGWGLRDGVNVSCVNYVDQNFLGEFSRIEFFLFRRSTNTVTLRGGLRTLLSVS